MAILKYSTFSGWFREHDSLIFAEHQIELKVADAGRPRQVARGETALNRRQKIANSLLVSILGALPLSVKARKHLIAEYGCQWLV